MGDIVVSRPLQVGLTGAAVLIADSATRQLVKLGVEYSRAAIERFASRSGATVRSVVQSVVNQARRYGQRSSISRKFGNMSNHKRPRTTSADKPNGQQLASGNVTLGDKAVYTKSSAVCRSESHLHKLSSYQMFMKNFVVRNIYRWQSIKEFNGSSTNRHRSLGLNTLGNKTAVSNVTLQALPMYAFDLGTIPCQGTQNGVGTKTGAYYESVPMYRLIKDTQNSGISGCTVSLKPTTKNYYWIEQEGYCNGPSAEYDGNSNVLWTPEIIRGAPNTYMGAKNIYTHIELLFKCHRKMPCVVHTSIVRFKNQSGPNRKYAANQAFVQGGSLTLEDMEDTSLSGDDVSNTDVFWEAFWDSRTAHPLAKYNIGKKMRHIEFLKDEIITINPEDVTLQEPYMHKKTILHSDGSTVDLTDNYTEDDTTTGGLGQQPPVCLKETAGQGHYDHPYGFNIVNRMNGSYEPYDPTTYAREKNCWLLIWMENSLPAQNIAIGTNYDMRKPATTMALDVECCSFDIRARRCVDLYTTKNTPTDYASIA